MIPYLDVQSRICRPSLVGVALITLTMWGCDSAPVDREALANTNGTKTAIAVAKAPVELDLEARRRAWARIEPRVNEFAVDVDRYAADCFGSVADFFEERRGGARAFAEELLSYWGKYQHVRGYFDTEAHDRYLKDCFGRHLFRPEELTAVIESAAAQFASKVKARENQLLVEIRADLGDELLGSAMSLQEPCSEATLRHQFEAMLVQISPVISREVGVEVAKQVLDWNIVSPILARLGTALATRLGLSGTILAGGAYSGVASFGIGVVVGMLVDQFIDWVFRQAGYDPVGDLEAKVKLAFGMIEELTLDGRWDPPLASFWKEAAAQLNGERSSQALDLLQGSKPVELEKGKCLYDQLVECSKLRDYTVATTLHRLITGEEFE